MFSLCLARFGQVFPRIRENDAIQNGNDCFSRFTRLISWFIHSSRSRPEADATWECQHSSSVEFQTCTSYRNIRQNTFSFTIHQSINLSPLTELLVLLQFVPYRGISSIPQGTIRQTKREQAPLSPTAPPLGHYSHRKTQRFSPRHKAMTPGSIVWNVVQRRQLQPYGTHNGINSMNLTFRYWFVPPMKGRTPSW